MTIKPRIQPMTPGIAPAARARAHVAAVVISFALVGLGWRAYALQVDDSEHYRALANKQHGATVDLPAARGEVLDLHGRPLAVSAEAESIWANPRGIRDLAATAEQLATLVGGHAAAFEAKLAVDKRFVWIGRHVKPEIAAAVRAAKLPGIEVVREPRRWYPAGTIAGPVVGRSDIDGNGLDGIELAMNQYLTGTRGAGRAVRDARGRKMFADGIEAPEPGATVRLTLDRSVQAIADAALAEAIEAHEALSGTAVVLDVATSRVLAISSYPTYDPNNLSSSVPRNRAITDTFEAGSVMKLFSIAAALDAGVVTPETEFEVRPIQIGPKSIRDTYVDLYLSVAGIIKRSSNVGSVKIAQLLGKERLHAALVRFGFGAKTEIELPGEQRGTLRPGAKWREIEHATISYGYGMTVTPLQVAAALAAIGNDGVYRAPRIVDSVTDPDGNVLYTPTVEPRQVIRAATARQMRGMLASVFEGGRHPGTGAGIVVPGFKCGGKTGTARKWDPEAQEYSPDRHLSSFAGLAPNQNPRLAIVVLVDEPRGGDYHGGKVAGPVFAKIASESLRYLGVPGESLVCKPTPPGVNPALVTTPKTCTLPPEPAVKPPVAAPQPPDAPEPAETSVPDLRGMGVRRAIDTAREYGFSVEVVGKGDVIAQDPAPGSVRTGDRITLQLEP
jgi:cell division protein FtsI (penicillin-binding protein 3)